MCCVELTSHSPPPTPLLPALTLSADEHQVSGGEFKVSRTRGTCLTFYALVARSPKWPASFFGGLFKTPVASPWWSHRCPIRTYGPRRCPPDRRLNWDCWLCLFGSSYAISSTTVYLLHYLRRTATVIARKKATPDELEARAEANGYQRGRTGKDSRRDGNKHEDKTKKNQDATLDHYVM
jgi:hypothetical protein